MKELEVSWAYSAQGKYKKMYIVFGKREKNTSVYIENNIKMHH